MNNKGRTVQAIILILLGAATCIAGGWVSVKHANWNQSVYSYSCETKTIKKPDGTTISKPDCNEVYYSTLIIALGTAILLSGIYPYMARFVVFVLNVRRISKNEPTVTLNQLEGDPSPPSTPPAQTTATQAADNKAPEVKQ